GCELLDGVGAVVRRTKVAGAVEGQAVRVGPGGEDGADGGGGEVCDGVVAGVCRVEVACAVEGQAEWAVQAGVGEDGADAAGSELLDGVAPVIGHIDCIRGTVVSSEQGGGAGYNSKGGAPAEAGRLGF